jgi:DNA repair exonuclease SbcCD ATPase subunit
MAPRTAQDVLATLQSINADHEISILKLSEPISSSVTQSQDPHQRTSDISTSSLDATTPSSLEADLTHYRELFSKLRFSYVEQVTKEKFIRAIVGDPPLIVSPQENADLEKENLEAKATLKALKTEVADMVIELEKRARDLSKKYEIIKLETVKLGELPGKIADLETAVSELKEAQAASLNPNPDLNLPLAKTTELVDAKKRQRDELDRQLEQLQSQAPRKKKELDRLHAELQPLETKRQNSTAAAREARRRKEAALGGVEDDLEERGRWYRAAEANLKNMLEIES